MRQLAVAGLFAPPLAAQAQGIAGGAAQEAQQGGEAALGVAVGGAVGGVAGGVAGLLGVDQLCYARTQICLQTPVTVGVVLPPEGVTFYTIPRAFGVPPSYRYAVVNDEVVLVDPVTRQVVDVVD